MKILKFGGASVKDAEGIKNLKKVLEIVGFQNTVLVISAMGKMTNAFEEIVDAFYFNKDSNDNYLEKIQLVKTYHNNIVNELFENSKLIVINDIKNYFEELNSFLSTTKSNDYNFIYDQVVSVAELLSTKICSFYLSENGIENKWVDVRNCIKSNDDFRRARVNWNKTEEQIKEKINPSIFTITQGFIASDTNGRTTTLGREGSDYTAGIFAYCLDAKEVSIFKDVDGVFNADPKVFKQTTLLDQISYKEAIEMAFYGASVIHPKTLQPLQRKEIPLKVKSFLQPKNKGTSVSKGYEISPKTPCYIIKKNQILLSISDKEFNFIMENDISKIFDLLHQFKIKVNLIQNSAISFSVCIEDNFANFNSLFEKLHKKYKVLYNKNLTLYTIRHFNEQTIAKIEKNKEVFIKQLSRETAQILVKN